ncbi:RNA-directed DNA polymerase, eukaryota, partial [Tanacetum coccineum]
MVYSEDQIETALNRLFEVEQKEVAYLRQIAKCKWALEGDETTKFFHNIINGRRRKQNIHGVQSNVSWVIEPNDIKRVFFDHFSCQFREPSYSRPELFSSKFKRLSVDQCLAIERPFCDEEIKTAVWECGDDKAPGLMEHKSKLMIFKVDFEKAFDSIHWSFLDNVMILMGFGFIWRNLIKGCFNSTTSSVFINGSPSKEFSLERGLRQGDPLSTFLFLVDAEALHVVMEEATEKNIFRGIRVAQNCNTISHLQFADDVLFVGK